MWFFGEWGANKISKVVYRRDISLKTCCIRCCAFVITFLHHLNIKFNVILNVSYIIKFLKGLLLDYYNFQTIETTRSSFKFYEHIHLKLILKTRKNVFFFLFYSENVSWFIKIVLFFYYRRRLRKFKKR